MLKSIVASSDQRQEVPVPVCWLEKGRVAGTIGGGSVEYRAELMALDILEKKESCEHRIWLNRKDVENIGMICGGDVTVFSSIWTIMTLLLWNLQ